MMNVRCIIAFLYFFLLFLTSYYLIHYHSLLFQSFCVINILTSFWQQLKSKYPAIVHIETSYSKLWTMVVIINIEKHILCHYFLNGPQLNPPHFFWMTPTVSHMSTRIITEYIKYNLCQTITQRLML